MLSSPSGVAGFLRRFLPVWAAGLIGVASLLAAPLPAGALPEALAHLPSWQVRLLVLVNPLVLVTVAAALGAAVAARVSLGSWLAGTAPAPQRWRGAALIGLGLGAAVTAVDLLVATGRGEGPAAPSLLVGVLYGGLAEEIIVRWGLMAMIAWALARAGFGAGAYWVALSVSALVFAAAHLPMVLLHPEAGPWLLGRSLVWNTLLGGVYGWLFWKRSLEAAMLAHASTHVGMVAMRALLA